MENPSAVARVINKLRRHQPPPAAPEPSRPLRKPWFGFQTETRTSNDRIQNAVGSHHRSLLYHISYYTDVKFNSIGVKVKPGLTDEAPELHEDGLSPAEQHVPLVALLMFNNTLHIGADSDLEEETFSGKK